MDKRNKISIELCWSICYWLASFSRIQETVIMKIERAMTCVKGLLRRRDDAVMLHYLELSMTASYLLRNKPYMCKM